MKRYYKIENGKTVFFNGNVLYTDSATIINPSEDVLLANGWLEYVTPELTEEELLAQAKMYKIMEIEYYDSSDAVNQFLLGSVPMWLDAPTRQQLRISIEAYQSMGAAQVSKWFMGQQFTFPTSAWLSMLNALEVYAAEALNVTESHKAAINAMTNIEDIENYDITAGYPEKLNLTTQWLAQHA